MGERAELEDEGDEDPDDGGHQQDPSEALEKLLLDLIEAAELDVAFRQVGGNGGEIWPLSISILAMEEVRRRIWNW